MKNIIIVYSILISCISIKTIAGQSLQKEPDFYNWFDSQINNSNTGLFNGLEYIEKYRTINERHKFYKSSEFQLGSVTYDGQFYDKVPLKYDLDEDQLLFNVGYNYPYPTLILFNSKVSNFTLEKSNFIAISYREANKDIGGFYELLLEKQGLILLKKNKKKRFRRIEGNTVYFEFEDKSTFVIKYKGVFYEVSSKKDLASIWPAEKDFINKYYNAELLKNNSDDFWTSFFFKLTDTIKNQ